MTDYEKMMVSALRYALGRRSYIVKMTCNYIAAEISKLSDRCKAVMVKDIEEQERFGYGDPCDKANWMRLLEQLKGAINETVQEA